MTTSPLCRLVCHLMIATFLGLGVDRVVHADGPKDNFPDNVRPIPPLGIELTQEQAQSLRKKLDAFTKDLESLKNHLKANNPSRLELLPDVEIFGRAVRQALELREFHNPKEVAAAERLLEIGQQRIRELHAGQPSWLKATGNVVRGYRSKIDDTVQPYGIWVPESFTQDPTRKRRLDFWWHGRGETLSENNFITGQLKNMPPFLPEDAFVLQPYGRYSNANKFAGEVDTFECLEHARKYYAIDDRRIVARGFSMGGAACWQFAVHFPTFWCAANPGAGFAETPEFLDIFQNEKVQPTWYEQKLWHLYNATDYAQNLFNLPTVAYSGELDKQKQAADVMAREMKKVGLELTHILGPKTGHKYEDGAKREVARLIDAIVAKGKPHEPRTEFKFVTYTLRYNRCSWLTVTGLEHYWSRAEAHGRYGDGRYDLTTQGITALAIHAAPHEHVTVVIDGAKLIPNLPVEQPTTLHFHKDEAGRWVAKERPAALAKMPGLQGPIDDAFMDRFLIVLPSQRSASEAVERFVASESQRAIQQWRKHFRGDARVKQDGEVTDADIAESHLVLWGDPASNRVLARLAEKLPVRWQPEGHLVVGDQKHDARTHVPLLIYPNPLNPKKYVVLNSGFTFREYAYLNNARQVPMLPDYAVVDVTTPPNSRYPGKIVQAGFFGERWEWLPNDGR